MDVNNDILTGESDQQKSMPLNFALSGLDENGKKEFWAALALRHCSGLGVKTNAKLIKHYGSAYRAFNQCEEWPIYGISPLIVKEMLSERWREKAKREWDAAHKLDTEVLLWTNPAYPERLREIADPPLFLYFKGDINLINSPCIAIVGSRAASGAGLKLAGMFSGKLSGAGITIVSGMALGIDKCAHEAAIEEVGKSIGVLGTGINIKYPSSNKGLYRIMEASGLLVSDFEPGKIAGPYSFPVRNRLISGLSIAVLVIEAAEKSGSLITARLALEQNREVFAVPAPPFSSSSIGCQNLLRNGAHPAFNVEDIIRELSDTLKTFGTSKPVILTSPSAPLDNPSINRANESRKEMAPAGEDIIKKLGASDYKTSIIKLLKDKGAMPVDNIANTLSIPVEQLNVILVGMEITGQIKKLPGASYAINN